MKAFCCIFVLAVFAAMASGCDGGGGCNRSRTIALTEADNGQTVEMNLVDQIEVTLSANATTGFVWENVLIEGSIIAQVGDSVYTVNPSCAHLDGCGGTETFTFAAVETGTGSINLIYHQPFSDADPLKVFEITVIVN